MAFYSAEYNYYTTDNNTVVNQVVTVAPLIGNNAAALPAAIPLNGRSVSDGVAKLGFFRYVNFMAGAGSNLNGVSLSVTGTGLGGPTTFTVNMPNAVGGSVFSPVMLSSVTSINQTSLPISGVVTNIIVGLSAGGLTPWFKLDPFLSNIAAVEISNSVGVFQPIMALVIKDFSPAQTVYNVVNKRLTTPYYTQPSPMAASVDQYASTYAETRPYFGKYLSIVMGPTDAAEIPTGSCYVSIFQPRVF